MRQATNNTGTIILGVLAGGVFVIGALALFLVTALDQGSAGSSPAVASAGTVSTVDPSLPVLPQRNFTREPLAVGEKAEMAQGLAASLVALDGGWMLRPFAFDDIWALRSDLGVCTGSMNGKPCVSLTRADGNGMWTYQRGEERIAVMISYARSRTEQPRQKIMPTPKQPHAFAYLFRDGVPSGAWRDAGSRAGFTLTDLPASTQSGAQVDGLQRITAKIKNDGEVQVHLASNADRETTLRVLDTLDNRLIKALVAKPVLGKGDAVASIKQRKVVFDVISDADLRTKVADMSVRQRNAYAKGLMKDALTNGRGPDDYAIVYQAMGKTGRAETVQFLTGKMPRSHPGYKVLETEMRRSLPIGTCLLTPHKVYCGKQAEYLRIAHEIRRRNHASAKMPSE